MTGPYLPIEILVIKYTTTVRNKFNTLQEISVRHTPSKEYEYIITAHMKVATESILTKPRTKCRVPWE